MVQALVDHAPALAPDLQFLFLKSPGLKTKLASSPNASDITVRPKANDPRTQWLLPEFAPLSDVGVFHAPSNLLPSRLRSKTVTTVHDIMWLTEPQLCDASRFGTIKRRFYQNGLRHALAHSDRIATVSDATRAAIIAFDPRTEESLSVTRSGVSTRFRPVEKDETALARLGLSRTERFALIVGQFAPYKNHERALRAFAKGLAGRGDARLVLIQRQGSGAAKLRPIAKALGIEDKLIFHETVSQRDLIQLYSSADMLLHPSLCEGFGNPLAEAMACGCPVITSDRSAMPEVTGGAAKLVDPYSVDAIATALSDLWHDPARRSEMRAAGLERTRALDWKEFARANVAIYRKLIA